MGSPLGEQPKSKKIDLKSFCVLKRSSCRMTKIKISVIFNRNKWLRPKIHPALHLLLTAEAKRHRKGQERKGQESKITKYFHKVPPCLPEIQIFLLPISNWTRTSQIWSFKPSPYYVSSILTSCIIIFSSLAVF